MRRFLSSASILMVKDLRLLSRDRGTLAVLFLLPLLFSLIIGAPMQIAGRMTGASAEAGAGPAVIRAE